MFATDAVRLLNSEVPLSSESVWFDQKRTVAKKSGYVISGNSVVGDHGPEWQPDLRRPVEAEAILDCGHRLQFAVAPVTGEFLYCSRCREWQQCRVPGGLLFRCLTCGIGPESDFGHNATLALARARKHRVSRDKTIHSVEIGVYTETDVVWKPYQKEMSL